MLNNTLQETVKIAYVEDEPSIAQLLVSGLGLFGIEVRPVFMSAEELLKQTDSEALAEVDLFFFDIRLPRMTGLDLAGKLRELGEKRSLSSSAPGPLRRLSSSPKSMRYSSPNRSTSPMSSRPFNGWPAGMGRNSKTVKSKKWTLQLFTFYFFTYHFSLQLPCLRLNRRQIRYPCAGELLKSLGDSSDLRPPFARADKNARLGFG